MRSTRLAVISGLLWAGAWGSPQALPVTDEYIGGQSHGYGDVIGESWLFDVHSAEVSLSGTQLTLSVHTNFAGRGDDGLFAGYTAGRRGIGYGDLFLAGAWTPQTPTSQDDHANGTLWSYGFSLDDRWMSSGTGSGTLYALGSGDNAADALLSDDFMTGAVYRNGQEVAVNTASAGVSAVGSGSWTIDAINRLVTFNIDLAGTSLLSGPELAFHWGMTCANDVIEGSVKVPEPPAMALLMAGLLGVAATRLTRRRS